MIAPLPAWARSGTALALLARIRDEGADHRITRGQWIEGGGARHYEGAAASQLRAIRTKYLDEAYAIADARFAAGEPWEACGVPSLDNETADALIERLLALEAVLDLTVQSLGGGAYRVAA